MSILVRPLALAFCVLVLPAFLSAQKQATIVHNANLRADPSTDNPAIQALAQGAHVFLIDAKPKNGFYHVRTGQQKEGWVWSNSVSFQPGGDGSSRKLVRRPTVVETERLMGRAAAGCATDLNSCPANGCAAPDEPHGLANQLKRRVPTGGSTIVLSFDDFQALQQQADNLVGENKELTGDDRA